MDREKETESIDYIKELQNLARQAINQDFPEGLKIMNGFIKDRRKFLDKFDYWMYQVPIVRYDDKN